MEKLGVCALCPTGEPYRTFKSERIYKKGAWATRSLDKKISNYLLSKEGDVYWRIKPEVFKSCESDGYIARARLIKTKKPILSEEEFKIALKKYPETYFVGYGRGPSIWKS